jgi:hypothetical protein
MVLSLKKFDLKEFEKGKKKRNLTSLPFGPAGLPAYQSRPQWPACPLFLFLFP